MDSSYVIHQIIISALVVAGFICTKTILDNVRRRTAKISVIIIGGGPIGLSALLVAARCSRVARIVLYEELCRKAMFCTPHQIAFDVKSVHFLKRHGVDFDNIEGCWDTGCFYTRLAVFQEYMLDLAPRVGKPVDIRTGTKVNFTGCNNRMPAKVHPTMLDQKSTASVQLDPRLPKIQAKSLKGTNFCMFEL